MKVFVLLEWAAGIEEGSFACRSKQSKVEIFHKNLRVYLVLFHVTESLPLVIIVGKQHFAQFGNKISIPGTAPTFIQDKMFPMINCIF